MNEGAKELLAVEISSNAHFDPFDMVSIRPLIPTHGWSLLDLNSRLTSESIAGPSPKS